jgi:hypothetical protein
LRRLPSKWIERRPNLVNGQLGVLANQGPEYQYRLIGNEAPILPSVPAISIFFESLYSSSKPAFDSSIPLGHLIMPDRFMSAVLTALNESAEVKQSDWQSIEAVLRGAVAPADVELQGAGPRISENRFAATVSSCMARARSGR